MDRGGIGQHRKMLRAVPGSSGGSGGRVTEFKQTPLNALHRDFGARMVEFAGYEMPVQFSGVMDEHLHVRSEAGLFDVSHMGQVRLAGAAWEEVALALETLVPQDVLGLQDGRQRYAFFTNEQGGIEDDLMISRHGDELVVVVNAACKEADLARLQTLAVSISLESDQALLALQGPASVNVLGPDFDDMRFMDVRNAEIAGCSVWLSRSGYTGEDGFEISVAAEDAQTLARHLLDHPQVKPIGLGARDSLRLEAGLCLYGTDMDAGLNPVEANLAWAIQKVRRRGGDREGGFPGASIVLAALKDGVHRKRAGLRPEGRAPMRREVPLFADEKGGAQIGFVTSGGFGPSVGAPVAMGIVADSLNDVGTRLWGEVRGRRLPVEIVQLPFVPARFKR